MADDEPGSAAYMLQLTCFSAPQDVQRVLGSHYVQERIIWVKRIRSEVLV